MWHRHLLKNRYASGDIGGILLAVVIVTCIFALEISYGYDDVLERFENKELTDDDIPVDDKENSNWWDGIVDFLSGVADAVVSAITGFMNVLGLFWDLMTFNLNAFTDISVVIRILLCIPLWTAFFYMGAKIVRGF
ncbi:MAG: hypothetical protein H7836_18170 [Magnetococcus sp. YQC-3]